MRSDRLVAVVGIFRFFTFGSELLAVELMSGLDLLSSPTEFVDVLSVTSLTEGTGASDSDLSGDVVWTSGDGADVETDSGPVDFFGRPLTVISASGVSSLSFAGLALDQ